MNAQALTPAAPSRLRIAAQRLIARALPTWVYPGPVTSDGIYTQDSGFLPWCYDWNFWQEGHRPTAAPECAAVEACVSAYAQTASMLPAAHWRSLPNGGRVEVIDSPLASILRKPNPYQTRSDFILFAVRSFYLRGNSYALAERDARDRIIALHPLLPNSCKPYVSADTQEVFYSIAPTDVTPPPGESWAYDPARMVPARDVWHLKFNANRSPIIGETPLAAAAAAISSNVNIQTQQARFSQNMSRPSGTLNTDATLTKQQVEELRKRWQEQSAGIALGGVPILTQGLKWTSLSMTAHDAQLIQFYKMTIADIARVMRVPLPMLAESDSTFANTEALMQFWVASGLGFLLEHIETSLDAFFDLPRGEYCELDTDALLRSSFATRIDALVKGVQGGVFSPNDARHAEGLPSATGGDEPRVQQQVVPLTYFDDQLELEREKLRQSAAPPPPPVPDETLTDARAWREVIGL